MIRRAAVAALAAALAGPCATAVAATRSQLDAWLASTPAIERLAAPSGPDALRGVPYVRVRGSENGTGWAEYRDATDGYLADGRRRVMVVPIESGGSGGVFTALLFTQAPGERVRFVGPIASGGGHLGVSIAGGALLIQTPVYGANDPNCCPSALHYQRATVRGTRLVNGDAWDVKLAKR